MLCKCSGKYIDIYFNLKITFPLFGGTESRPLFRFFILTFVVSLWNPNLPVFILTSCILCIYECHIVIALLHLYCVGAHNAFS